MARIQGWRADWYTRKGCFSMATLVADTIKPSHDGTDRSLLEYELARLPREVTTAITWYMEEERISQRELAKRMKITPGRVSQILSGDENLTLRTLAAVCAGLGAHFQVDLVPNTGEEAAQDRPSAQAHRERLLRHVARPASQVEESSYSR
jgi:transcriptional regulator with XRE-family HTH domain